jgi:hypothetical protein
MSYLGPVDGLQSYPWSYEVDFTAGDAAEQYARAGFRCVRGTTTEYVDSNGIVRVAPPQTPVFEFDKETGRALGLRCERAHNNYLHSTENLNAWANWFGGLPGLTKGFPDPAGGSEAWSFRIADIPQGPGAAGDMAGGMINTGTVIPTDGVVHTAEVWVRCDVVRQFSLGFSDAMSQYTATPQWKKFRFTDVWTAAKDLGRLCQLVFSYSTSELAAGSISADTRFYLWHPWMWQGSVGMSYIKADNVAPYADQEYHYADLHPMFAGYNPEGALFIEWERKGQTVNVNDTNGLFQMSTPGAAPDVYSYFGDNYPKSNSVAIAQYWNGQASAVEGPLRNNGAPGGKGIQRLAFGWYKSGNDAPGAAFNSQAFRRMNGGGAASAGMIGFTRFVLGARIYADPLDGYIRKVKFHRNFNPNVPKDALPAGPTAQSLSELTNDRLWSTDDFT